ncbi:MAG: carbohydrate kinase family protein [Actinobacteria bacterium]|nr:carbohydrate kinase family protein [Actinomycetota bacterium]
MDVIGIGACNLDMIAFVSKFPEAEQKINALKYIEPKVAGVALDAITQLSRLGINCGFIGKIGDDNLSKNIIKELKEDNIDTTGIITIKDTRSSFAWIMVTPNGERCHIIIPMEKGVITDIDVTMFSDYLKSSKYCHIEILQMPLYGQISAAKLCFKNNIKVSLDLDIAPRFIYEYKYATPTELEELFSYTYLLKVCKDGVQDLSSEKDYLSASKEILYKYNPKICVITLGNEGCVGAYYDDKNNIVTFKEPTFSIVKVKDTTGAGDSFQGGFIYGLLKNWSIEKSASFGNLCASLKCQNIGARSMPYLNEIKNFIKLNNLNFELY